MRFDEAQLYRAAKLADAIELARLPDADECPPHEFSEKFEREMEELLRKLERNELTPYRVRMGWQYYTKRGIAAILICFLLTCVTMPEAVVAGYHKLIEVIENVMEERTDYHYSSTVPADTEFVPIKLGYMPDGMKLVREYVDDNEFRVIYGDGDKYFTLQQRLLTEEGQYTLAINSEGADITIKILCGMQLDLLNRENGINYIWHHKQYYIMGKTNLPMEELEKILNNMII